MSAGDREVWQYFEVDMTRQMARRGDVACPYISLFVCHFRFKSTRQARKDSLYKTGGKSFVLRPEGA